MQGWLSRLRPREDEPQETAGLPWKVACTGEKESMVGRKRLVQ